MITPNNALKLSAWLAVHEPGFFRRLLAQTQKLQRSPLGRLGMFGDDSSLLSDVSLDPGTFEIPADTTSAIDTAASVPDFSDVTLSDVSVDIPDIPQSTTDAINQAIAAPDPSTPADASNVSSGFWSTVGSNAGSVLGAVGKVASALLSPQTITAASNAASAYFRSQATTAQAQAQAQTQQAVVQAQLSRVAQGAAPAPLSYVRDPGTGALTPVYYSNTGVQPATPSMLNQLANTAGISPGALIGGGLVVAVLLALLLSRN